MACNLLIKNLKISKFSNFRAVIINRGFKSEYSLDKIYPESSLDISKSKVSN